MLRRFPDFKNRLPGLLIAILLAGAIFYFAVAFGPVPEPAALTVGGRTVPGAPISSARAEIPVSQPEMLVALFGGSRTIDSEGCASTSPDRFTAQVEESYRKEGYRSVQQSSPLRADPNPGQAPRIYWLLKGTDAYSIGAFGSGRTAPMLEVTSAAAEPKCGTYWRKYHYEAPRSGSGATVAGLREDDNSGQLPLPPGSRRLFTLPARSGADMKFYSVAMAAAAARQWFRGSMSRRWLDVNPPGNRTPAGRPDLMYFTQVDRYCMIYVGDKPQPDGNSVVVVSIGRI